MFTFKLSNKSLPRTRIKSNNFRHLKICHQNIQNLPTRVEQLEIVLSEMNPGTIFLTEHNTDRTD